MIKVLGIGAGGHAKVIMEILRLMGNYEVVALLDSNERLWGSKLMEVPIIGDDNLLTKLHKEGLTHAFIGLGSIGDTNPRKNLYKAASETGFKIVNAIHPKSIVSPSISIGDGVTIMAGSIVNISVGIGNNVIVNSGAIIEHDCVLGDNVHIATGAKLASTVKVGAGTHIGAGATIKQSITIGEQAIVGAGAVVIHDVPNGTTVAGVPAQIIKNLKALND